MYVTTSKDAYAYQNLAGSSGVQTIGLNFVAPVNCLLPDNLDNIPDITNVAGTTLTGGITIIASTTTPDSNITVNDDSGVVTMPASIPVAGSADWKTFYISNLTGNVSVQSTGPIAVGFFGVNANRGIAGYFSGFDTVPTVDLQVQGGGCLPGAIIEVVDANFDAYQWFQNGTSVPGAIFSSYNPNEAGDYFVRVTKGGCTYDSQPIAAYYCFPDIVINKTADTNSVVDGELVEFTITVESLGVNDVTNLVLTDLLPDGLELVSSSISKGTFTEPDWTVGTMRQGELESLTLVTRAGLNNIFIESATYTNTVTHAQDQTDSDITTDDPSETITVTFQAPTSVITNRRITHRVKKN